MITTTTDAEKVAAFDALATLDPYLFMDNATYFACTQANVIAVFVEAAHGQEMATAFLVEHSASDGHTHDLLLRESVIDKEIK